MLAFFKKPKVSIIIPVYNTSRWLIDCLVSVQNQTLKHIEIICINDGSTDNSLKILTKFENEDDRITIINQENNGLSSARNRGLEKACGKYVYFLDSDDMLSSNNILQELYDLSIQRNLDMIIGGAEVLYDNTELEAKYSSFKTRYIIKGFYDSQLFSFNLIKQLIQNKDYYSPVSLKFYNLKFIKTNDLKFIDGQLHEDEIFTYKSIILASQIYVTNKPLYIRRIRDNSIMTTRFTHKNIYGLLVNFIESIKFLNVRNYISTQNKDVCFLPKQMINITSNKYNKLNKAEKEFFINMLSYEEMFYFDTFIKPVIDLKQHVELLKKKIS